MKQLPGRWSPTTFIVLPVRRIERDDPSDNGRDGTHQLRQRRYGYRDRGHWRSHVGCVPSSCAAPVGASVLVNTDGTDQYAIISNANGSAFGTAANSTAGTSGSDVLQLSSGLVPAANLPAANRIIPCGVGIWGGGSAIAAATYHVNARCLNVYGVTYTITGVTCQADNSGTSTANVADSGSNALLTGAITMGTANTFVAGTQSATTTIASNVWTNWTFVADGTSTSIQCVMTTTR